MTCSAVRADQREEAGQKAAARGSRRPCSTMPANSVDLDEEEGRAEHESAVPRRAEKRPRCRRFGGQRPEPACVAREQQAHRLDEDIAEIEQLGPGRSAGGVARQHRIGREQPREHDDVAEDEDPEAVGDDDARRGRSAAAPPARELGGNRVDRCYRHAGRPRPSRARSIRAISVAEISRSRSSLQPNTRTVQLRRREDRGSRSTRCARSARSR